MRRLAGEVVVLEPLEQRHAADLYAASRDPAVWRWLPRPQPDREGLEALVAEAVAAREAGTEGPFLTRERASGGRSAAAATSTSAPRTAWSRSAGPGSTRAPGAAAPTSRPSC